VEARFKVEASREALEELAKRGVKAVTLRLAEDVQEWTMCCYGGVCVVSPKVVVEEGKGDGKRFEVGGVEVYVSEDVLRRVKEAIRLVVKQGEVSVEGVDLEASYHVSHR
jgi:hypothetical protein